MGSIDEDGQWNQVSMKYHARTVRKHKYIKHTLHKNDKGQTDYRCMKIKTIAGKANASDE